MSRLSSGTTSEFAILTDSSRQWYAKRVRRWVIIGLAGLLAVVGGAISIVSATASDSPSFPTSCGSGKVVDNIPGEDVDPAAVGPVVLDTAISEQLYGDSVNVTDGISDEELPVVKEVASKIKFCWVEDANGDHWQAFMPG